MTREEAITVLKTFMENPLFSDEHKQAFNIAIHDIKAYHAWNINNLILINKDNYEPLEQESILDKIRAEIKKQKQMECFDTYDEMFAYRTGLENVIDIIDKYKAEKE